MSNFRPRYVLLCAGVTVIASIGYAQGPRRISAEAERVHRESLVFDGHNNLLMALRNRPELNSASLDLAREQPALHTDLPRLRRGGIGAEFFAVYISADCVAKGVAVRETLEQLDELYQILRRYPDVLEVASSANDIVRIRDAGKIAALVSIEGGNAIQNSLVVLRTYYQAGARRMALTHDHTTDWADAALDKPKHGGLSRFGESVVREMNQLGMLIDLSHASEETIKDTLAVTRAPVMFSHSGAYHLAPHPRNLSDDVLRRLAQNGGVVMVNFYPGFLTAASVTAYEQRTKAAHALRKSFKTDEQFQVALSAWLKEHPLPETSVRDVVDHIDHIAKVAGIDHVGLGSGFDGVVSVSRQLEDVSCFPNVTQELLNRGYSREQIHKVLGANALRVLREVELAAQDYARLQPLSKVRSSGPVVRISN